MKSPEEKAANALRDAVSNINWNPVTFANHVLRMETAVQWRILTAFVTLCRVWKKSSALGGHSTIMAAAAEGDEDTKVVMEYIEEGNDCG